MKCPNCDFVDTDEAFGKPATCPSCGAIYEKALVVRALRDEQEADRKAKAEAEAEKAKKEAERIEAIRAQHPARQAERLAAQERATADDGKLSGVLGHMAQGVAESRAQIALEDADRHKRSVVISDIQVPFMSILILMFKVFLAAIPAGIAAYIVYMVVIAIIGPIL